MNELPFLERNFHIMNDDRFIMEKISLPVEIQDGEDIHAALNRTRETIVQNFKKAYPHIEEAMNFHVVRNYNNNLANSNEWTKVPYTVLPSDAKFGSRNDNLNLPTTIPDKPTIEEPYDIIKEINSCKFLTVLKIYEKQCKTAEQKDAYKKKEKELELLPK